MYIDVITLTSQFKEMNNLYGVIVEAYLTNLKANYNKCDGCQAEGLEFAVGAKPGNNIEIEAICRCGLVITHSFSYQINHTTVRNILPKCMKMHAKFDCCPKCGSRDNVVSMAKLDGRECLDCGFSSLIDPDDDEAIMTLVSSNHPIERSLCPQCAKFNALIKHIHHFVAYNKIVVKLECYECKFMFVYDLETQPSRILI